MLSAERLEGKIGGKKKGPLRGGLTVLALFIGLGCHKHSIPSADLKCLGSHVDNQMPKMNARVDSLSRVAKFQPRLIDLKEEIVEKLRLGLLLFHGQTPDGYKNPELPVLKRKYNSVLDSSSTPSLTDAQAQVSSFNSDISENI